MSVLKRLFGRKPATPPSELCDLLVTHSLLATVPINESWAEITGENPMSSKSNSIVRMEILFFVLHMADRIAFESGGRAAQDRLTDSLPVDAIEAILNASFDATHAHKGFDVKRWRTEMLESAVEGFNEAQEDYGSCVDWYGKNRGGMTTSVVGKLAQRIAQEVGQDDNLSLQLLIYSTALEALNKSGIRPKGR